MKNKGSLIAKECGLAVLVLVALIAGYVLLMTLVFALPNANIVNNTEEAKNYIALEGDYPTNGLYDDGAILDNYTDRIMFETTNKYDELSNLFNALMSRGYGRYWHGYVTWLRPLVAHKGISEIRQVVLAVNMLLLVLAVCVISRRFGIKVTICFGLTLVAFRTGNIMYSLQYFSCYFLMYLGVIVTTLFYKDNKDNKFILFFFLVMGSVTNFMDLLTFPIITLSMPLIIIMLVEINDKKTSVINMAGKVIFASVIWGLSYGITWASKWIITKYALGSKIVDNALNQAKYRMFGDESFIIDRTKVLYGNITTSYFLKSFLLSIIPWIILFIIVAVLKKWKELVRFCPMAIICMMPYVWYEVLCNHSMQHRIFTYRAQMGTLFAIFLIFAYMLFPLKKKEME